MMRPLFLRLPPLALVLLSTACGPSAEQAAADARALDAQLTAQTIDGRPAPAKRTPDRLDAIPDAFRGRWATQGDCGAGAPMALTIERDTLRFAGRTGRADYILRAGPREISLELTVTDGGERRSDSTSLTLQPDGRLRRSDPDGTQVAYTRCR